MCGLVGVVAVNDAQIDPAVIRRMAEILRHRGPDDEGIYCSGSVGLGFRRLSILDLSEAGHQPMCSPDGETTMVFNGEIYNYVELREELESLGHRFRSSGDTEVLLHSYLQWGSECLRRLNGMWAFLIYDGRRGTVFGSRDRFGKKPLYHYRAGGHVFFGSEIKAIRASGQYQGGTNWNVASKFLLQNSFDHVETRNETFYSDVQEIPAGSAFELDLHGRWKEWRYWSLAEKADDADASDPAESFSQLFEDAVRLRLRSDVPVGIFLSGGLDSTSIACAVARIRNHRSRSSTTPLMCFSYQAKEFDESAYIDATIRQTGAELISFRPEPRQLWDTLERVLWYQDEPVHSINAVITFELSRLASARGVKVILNGAGPDEFLAGYHNFFHNYWYTLATTGRIRQAWREVCAYYGAHGGEAGSFFGNVLASQVKAAIGRVAAGRQLALWKRYRDLRNRSWFTPDLVHRLPDNGLTYTDAALDSTLQRAVEVAPLPLYLRIEDRNTMAHSIEGRMPFLDYRLVALAFRLPAHWKMRGPWNKYVLRAAMRDRIPESARSRLDKMGFPVAEKSWFAGSLYEPMLDLLGSREVRERSIYRVDAIRRDLELHKQGHVDVSRQLFNVLPFEMWSKLERNHRHAAVA